MEFRFPPTDEIIRLAAGLGLDQHTRPQFMTCRPEDLVRRRPALTNAMSTVKDGALCVFNVAVLPSARGRGIGRALTEAALAQDFTVACRQSSAAGRPLYESMGFRAAERWHTLEPA